MDGILSDFFLFITSLRSIVEQGDFLGGPVVKKPPATQRVQFPSLVRKLNPTSMG